MDSALSIEKTAIKMKTDITFLVGENEERIHAFKQTLALVSPVFMKMLYGPIESGDEIKISDYEANDFKQFLNYIYFHQVDFENCDTRNVYMIAHQYLITSLCELCKTKFYTEISEANALEAVKWNQIYQDKEIWERIKQFFIENTFEGLNIIKGFKDLTKETVVEILKWNEMRCSADLLYDNLLEWADQHLRDQNQGVNNTNKKKILVELGQVIGLKVNDDLSYVPVCSISSYNRTTFEITRMGQLVLSKEQSFSFIDCSSSLPYMVYGFKILLSNIKSDYVSEEFSITIGSVNYSENFKISVRDSLIVKDVYFKKPVTKEEGKGIEILGKFKTVRKRIFSYAYNKQTVVLKAITPDTQKVN